MKHFAVNIPIAIGLTKIDNLQLIEWSKIKMELNKHFQ
jgi:predicted PP-loop superfamily ATPase